jgi:hypothetical protein
MISVFWLGWVLGASTGIAWYVLIRGIVTRVREARRARRHVDAKVAAHEAKERA